MNAETHGQLFVCLVRILPHRLLPQVNPMLLVLNITLLLILNLASAVLIKISPSCYHNFILLGLLIGALGGIYAARAVLWLVLGKHYQLSFVYPLLGINYIVSLFFGHWFFNEPWSVQRFVGAAIILCGVFFLCFSKYSKEMATTGGVL